MNCRDAFRTKKIAARRKHINRKASPEGFYRLYIRKEAVKTRPKYARFGRRPGACRDPNFLRYFQFREQAANACSVPDSRNKRIQRSTKGTPKEPKGRGRERERTGKRTGRGRRASSGIVGGFAEFRSGRRKLLCDRLRGPWRCCSGTKGGYTPLDPRRAHLSDALGYMIYAEFGMRPKAGEMPGFIG